MFSVLLGAEGRGLVKRSEVAVAPPTGYLPSGEEEYEDSLAGYSADTFSLPGYSEDTEGLARDSEGLSTTTTATTLQETTTSLEEEEEAGGEIPTTMTAGDKH